MGVQLDWLRDARWIDARRRKVVLIMLAVANLAVLSVLLLTAHSGVDLTGELLGTDFLSFWTTGRMLIAGQNPYSVTAHIAAQRTFHADAGGFTGFFYPPVFLPICWFLGLLGYFAALVIWLAVTGGGFLLAVREWGKRLSGAAPSWLAVLAFPPALICITHGQTSFLAAILLGLGTLLLGPRPLLAGALFGLAIFKPQLGLLVPVVLLATRQFRAIASACLSALALAFVTTVWFGPQVWHNWLAIGPAASSALFGGLVGFAKFQSLYAGLRLVGLSHGGAITAQAMMSLGVAGWLARLGWKHGWSLELGAAMLAGALLATPFVLDYDLVLLAFPLVLLAGANPAAPWEKLVVALAFVMPQFARPFGELLAVPIAPPILLALFLVLFRRVERSQSTGADRTARAG